MRYLAESELYKIVSEYETVTLHFKKENRPPVSIAWIYGDPTCALISADQKYVVIAGAGISIYLLKKPFAAYGIGLYHEFFHIPPSIWWTNGLHQDDSDGDCRYFRFIAYNEEGIGVYLMDSETFAVQRILP